MEEKLIQKERRLLERMEEMDKVLDTLQAVEGTRKRVRVLVSGAGLGIAVFGCFSAAMTGDLVFLIPAGLAGALAAGVLRVTRRRYGKTIDSLKKEAERLYEADS